MRHAYAFATFALALAVALPAVAGEPLAVHVTGSTPKSPSKAAQEELRAKKDALRTAWKDLDEALRKQHGKNPEAWPAEKRDELQVAHDAFFEAQTDWFYSIDLKQKDIDDSVREVTQALSEKTQLKLATRPEDADLVVQVVGRAEVTHEGWGGQGTVAAQLVLRVGPGGRVDTPALAKSEVVWNDRQTFWKKSDTSTIHRFTEDAPYWLLISTKPGAMFMASYKGVAKQASEVIEKFGIENATKIEAARRTKS
jgi:hypothetical protein